MTLDEMTIIANNRKRKSRGKVDDCGNTFKLMDTLVTVRRMPKNFLTLEHNTSFTQVM
jgi:hypothetical protein